MSRTKGTFSLTSNIEPKFGAPLDARTIVKLKTDLTASGTFDYPYIGLTVFVEEENKKYTLVGSDPTVSANWVEDNSGGHTIKNPAGTAMTQRSNLQFVDLTVSDDSTNDVTKVENIHVIQSESELDNLPDGLYMLDEDEDTVIDGNLVGYDNTNSELDADNVQDAIDEVVEALDDKIDISAKGVANGVAELDSTGKVPSSQLPSFVDDVLEYSSISTFPATGETGKIYVALDTNKTYRWGGTEYVEISESLALGETSSTAYRGDRGKIAYDHSQLTSGNPHNVTKSDIGLGNVDNTSDSTKKTNFTGSIASGNTGFVTGGDAYTALNNKADKVSSATNGNLAGLNGSGNLTDSGWNGAKDTTSISGNPISISGLKANQLAKNPIITFEPIQDLHGQSKPYPAGGGLDLLQVTSDKFATLTCNVTVDGDNSFTVTSTGSYYPSASMSLENYKSYGRLWFYCKWTGTAPAPSVKLYDGGTYILDLTSGSVVNRDISSMTEPRLIFYVYSSNTGESGKTIKVSGITISKEAITGFVPYSNICPISGYDKIEVLSCGVNVWDEETIGGWLNADGTISSSTQGFVNKNPIRVIPNGTYYFHTGIDYSKIYFCVYDKAGQPVIARQQLSSSRAYTMPSNGYILYFMQADSGTAYNNDISINYPHTQTSYVPYHKTTDLSESLGQTVYGATWYPRTGKLLVDRAIIDLGNLTWNKQSYGFIATISSMLSGRNATEYADNPMVTCSMFATAESLMAEIQNTIRPTYSGTTGLSTATIVAFNTSYTDGNAFKTAVTGQKLVYPLATPFEIQLTPHEVSILKDYAYVSTNGTNIALDYHNGELASLSDVSQLGETVNELGMNLLNVVEDVTSKFVLDSTNVYTSTMQVLKIGKMVFISGSIKPQALTSLQNKKLFDITDNRLFPLVGASANITANFVPVETAQSTTLPLITVINSSYSQLRTLNNGAYGGITNITTSSLIIFSGAYVCKG